MRAIGEPRVLGLSQTRPTKLDSLYVRFSGLQRAERLPLPPARLGQLSGVAGSYGPQVAYHSRGFPTPVLTAWRQHISCYLLRYLPRDHSATRFTRRASGRREQAVESDANIHSKRRDIGSAEQIYQGRVPGCV